MSVKVYSRHCGSWNARSMGLMSIESCSKAILAPYAWHGKSPCFSGCAFLSVVGVDYSRSVFVDVYGAVFLECAF